MDGISLNFNCMISKKTLLILGAGASMHLGYPSGRELVNKIFNILMEKTEDQLNRWPLYTLGQDHTIGFTHNDVKNYFLLIEMGYSKEEIRSFYEALKYSGKASIDSFLEHRAEYRDIGKIVIAQVLFECENFDKLFVNNDDNWYSYLYNKMNIHWDDFPLNKLKVITYNYDRSFELYLSNALHYSYNKPMEDCIELLNNIEILHIHGLISDFDPRSENFLKYGNKASADNFSKSKESIKIIYEDTLDQSLINKAKNMIDDSERIYFLGFGFHELNISRIWDKERYAAKSLYATNIGLFSEEQFEISKKLKNHNGSIFWRGEVGISELLRRSKL